MMPTIAMAGGITVAKLIALDMAVRELAPMLKYL
jgi:hypothetical protein